MPARSAMSTTWPSPRAVPTSPRTEIDAFVDPVEDGTPTVGFDDGLKAPLLAEAAILSVREGRPVALSELE